MVGTVTWATPGLADMVERKMMAAASLPLLMLMAMTMEVIDKPKMGARNGPTASDQAKNGPTASVKMAQLPPVPPVIPTPSSGPCGRAQRAQRG